MFALPVNVCLFVFSWSVVVVFHALYVDRPLTLRGRSVSFIVCRANSAIFCNACLETSACCALRCALRNFDEGGGDCFFGVGTFFLLQAVYRLSSLCFSFSGGVLVPLLSNLTAETSFVRANVVCLCRRLLHS